jgi:HAD superfamily hydrolase (TIGR01484 family)
MRFSLLATDYDGTLATDGSVGERVLAALENLRASGRKLVLATGRHMPDLSSIFPRLQLFDRVVAENGGLLYRPDSRAETVLCDPPNAHLIRRLEEMKVPFSAGRAVIATWEPHDQEVLTAIRELGLDLQVVFNKGAVMVLPSGVNKGTGTQAALDDLGIAPHNAVAIGDAENDLPFLRLAGCSVAVANALPSVKETADIVLKQDHGDGVVELANHLVANDLGDFDARLRRHWVALGHSTRDDQEVRATSRGGAILIAGPSGSGKSTMITGILEQFIQGKYQFCLIDPEGDYEGFPGAFSFGSGSETPDTKRVLQALRQPGQSVVIDLLGSSIDDRPLFFASLLPYLQELRAASGRPHWIIVDEAHHMLPESGRPVDITVPQVLDSTILVTVHPEHIARTALNLVHTVVAIGNPAAVFESFADTLQIPKPTIGKDSLSTGEAMVWFRNSDVPPERIKAVRSTRDKLRHVRNYAQGELSREQSFYFRGPESKLNLRAQNLTMFLQLADGVDDDTWIHHLRAGHYSQWFYSTIKDKQLGAQTEQIEHDEKLSPQESRRRIRDVVESRYTAAA